MNSRGLKDKLRNISKEKKVDFNTLLRLYMYDRFIERLSISKYKDNFILKGGFYLSTLFGVENRATMDIDMAFNKSKFTKENIENMIAEIISTDINDNASINLLGIDSIRDEDLYGGYRVALLVEYENIKEKFHVDIVTGDPITPKEIKYKYKTLLEDKIINVWAYNIETVIAEKLETILERGELNGRMRDFYDIYLIYTKDWKNINKNHLNNAVARTFSKREYLGNPLLGIDLLHESEILKRRWNQYRKKYSYAESIEYEDIVSCLYVIVDSLKLLDAVY